MTVFPIYSIMLESLGETNSEELNMYQSVNITKLCECLNVLIFISGLLRPNLRSFYNREFEAIYYNIVEIAI
jgi:hypothetical protein